MKLEKLNITIGDICEGYINDLEEGVTAYNGLLDIRPKYQREFVYDDKRRNNVIYTVMRGLPLNVMYWCKIKRDDGTEGYEVLDGQQRTISFCEYVEGNFSVDDIFFHNLPSDKKKQILDYPLFIYVCEGTDSEKLEWFQIVNIAGKPLTDQEIRNAIYSGPWVSDAKRYFSKTRCAAYQLAEDYMAGKYKEQKYLETAISWIGASEGLSIEAYMAEHQDDTSAIQLWNYFRSVIEWVQAIFPVKRPELMKGRPWGTLYNEFGQRTDLDPDKLESEIQVLIEDPEVQKKSGVYEYVLTGDKTKLSLRKFDDDVIEAQYELQDHKCAICGKTVDRDKIHADHIIPWSKGGKTVPENCQILCRDCNLKKGAQEE